MAGAPFPEIYSVTSSNLRSRTDTVCDVDVSFQTAGVQPYTSKGYDVSFSGTLKLYPAPPFSGGNGYCTNDNDYIYAGSASLGGGGGAGFNFLSTGYGASGKGGMGAVLIFPISMG